MVSIVPRAGAPRVDRGALARFVQAVLGQRRKQLGGVLRGMGADLGKIPEGIDLTARAESLSPEAMLGLYRWSEAR